MIAERREEAISKAAHDAALAILTTLGPDFDPKEVARQISEEVGKILDKHSEKRGTL